MGNVKAALQFAQAKYAAVPNELKNLKQWGLFRKQWMPNRNKYNKIPVNPWDNSAGSSTDQTTWSDFDTAIRALAKYQADGLAFYFGNGYVGLDIDHIGEDLKTFTNGDNDNEVNRANQLTHGTYMEVSISNEGIHCIFKGKVPGNRSRHANYEMYSKDRFFALTGNVLTAHQVIKSLNDDEMRTLYTHYLGADKVVPLPVQNVNQFNNDLSIDDIINKIENSSQKDKFNKLMKQGWHEGDGDYPSHSEADNALASILAFWTGNDYHKMDEIFRNSKLYRPKWDKKDGATTYGVRTLNTAINETTNTYDPNYHQDPITTNYIYGDDFLKKINGGQLPKNIHRAFGWNDMGNANRFLAHYADIVRYSYIDKKWYIYNGSYWEADDTGVIWQLADKVVNDMNHEDQHFVAEDDKEDKKLKKAWAKFKDKCHNNTSKKNMVSEVQHHVGVKHEEFDKENMLLNTPSGYVDLSSGKLHEHDVLRMFSKETNAEYRLNDDCPLWLNFLNQIFDGNQAMIAFLQRAFGYSLTGSTQEQVAFFCLGEGQNGKSVCLNTIGNVVGSYAKTMNVSSVMLRNNSNGANSDIARLEGSRMVISSEANEGSRLDESLIKQITGGDKVVARYQYGTEFEFSPKFKLWMATNHHPFIRGTDNGIWRRIILIPFEVQIPKDKVDKNLTAKLKRESPGILNWMVQGAINWQREGLNLPRSVVDATNQYRKDMDVVDLFVDDQCEVGEEYQVKSKDLYAAYNEWARQNNEYDMSSKKFGHEMGKKYKSKHTEHGTIYQGLRLYRDPRNNFL